jgi:hypothetical protein
MLQLLLDLLRRLLYRLTDLVNDKAILLYGCSGIDRHEPTR